MNQAKVVDSASYQPLQDDLSNSCCDPGGSVNSSKVCTGAINSSIDAESVLERQFPQNDKSETLALSGVPTSEGGSNSESVVTRRSFNSGSLEKQLSFWVSTINVLGNGRQPIDYIVETF